MIDYNSLQDTSLETLIEVLNLFTKQTEPAFDDLNFIEKKPRISKVSNFESIDFLEWGFDKQGKYIDIMGVRFFLRMYGEQLYVPLHIKLDDKVSTIPAILELIKQLDPNTVDNIYVDEAGFDNHFEADYEQSYLVGAYYDNSLLTLEGKKYKQIRLQLNRVNEDIEAGLIRLEQIPVNKLSVKQLNDLLALIKKWVHIKKTQTTDKPNVKHAFVFIRFLKKLLEQGKLDIFNMLVITMVYDNTNDNCIGFGLSELSNNLVNCNIDTKVDYDYRERYPHLSKLINYYTAKQIIEHLNLDQSKVTHTIGAEYANIPYYASLLDYKITRVAVSHTTNIVKYLRSGKGTCRLKSRKRSIF